METQNNSFKKASEYISELKLMCKPNSWCSMIAFFGLASVLHRPIESLFPQTGNTFMNQIYNRIIMPRQGDHFYPHCIIMWSSISAKDFQSSGKSNHFVPVFKRKEYEQSPLIQEVLSLQNNHNDLTADKTNNEHITDSEVDPNTIIGLFMGIDTLSSLFICDIDKNQNFNYHWRDWQISNYHLFELLRKQPEFPPQISISVNKTYENNKTLVKQCYCGGCDKSNQTTFKIVVNKMDLIQLREVVKINVVYLTNKRKCKHLDGKMFGQCRGYARQVLAKSKDFGSPRDMRKKILLNVKNEVRYTDYTGQLVKPVPHYLTPVNNSNNKRILNAFYTMPSSYDRGILSKFAMRVWNSVRVTETLPNAEREIEKWEWIMKESHSWTYNLDNNVLLKIIQENNENYKILIPQLDITVSAQLSQSKSIKNPFYSLNLVKYMDKVWWKTIILWSNLVPAVKSRTRRTTATVEVENNIVKNLDIGKKNLPIDQYIYTRTQTLKSTQNLIAETLMRKKSTNLQTDTNDMYEQWKPKKRKVFSKEETDIMNNFKVVMEYRKGLDAPSQSRIALEIRELSTHSIGFNQSMVS
ncbi:7316_t:CDS:2, partial [Rhizophagus irregularis]